MEHAYWKQMIEIEENGIFLVFGITRNDQIKFLHVNPTPNLSSAFPFVSL